MNRTTKAGGGSVAIKTDALAALRAELEKNKSKRVQVGVLGGNDARSGDESGGYVAGNAEIGVAHEFGLIGGQLPQAVRAKAGLSKEPAKSGRSLPERSFLRMPVITQLPEAIKAQGKENWRKAILQKGVVFALKNLGILAEGVIQDAFKTGGFGTWAKLKPATIRRKKSDAILIDTAQLRQSITSRVVG